MLFLNREILREGGSEKYATCLHRYQEGTNVDFKFVVTVYVLCTYILHDS